MDAGIVLVLGLIVVFFGLWATAIGGSIDALSQPREAWARAGFRRRSWVWQALGVFFLPAALGYSGLYFVRVRPRLVAAARDLAIEHLAIEQGAVRAQLPVPHLPAGPHVERIKIRIAPTVAAASVIPLAVGYVIGFGLAALGAGSLAALPWHYLIGSGVAGLLVAAANLGFGITLTPHELVMRGLRRRRVAWSDVVAITSEATLGSHYIRLWTRTGRRRRLRAPVAQLGIGRRRFDTDFAVLEQWWLSHTPATD